MNTLVWKGYTMSINKIVLIGNLTRDPDFKELSNVNLCKLSLAVNSGKKGTDSEEVCFVDVTVWGSTADACAQYLKKGRKVAVEGRLKLESWEKDGKKNSKHVIVASSVDFLFNKDDKQDNTSVDDSRVDDTSVDEPQQGRMYNNRDTNHNNY